MLLNIIKNMLRFFERIFNGPCKPLPPADPMLPFELAAEQRRNNTWNDIPNVSYVDLPIDSDIITKGHIFVRKFRI